ncbi:unnamed protein product, partial [Ectocarpus sp. 6 AP-2014]
TLEKLRGYFPEFRQPPEKGLWYASIHSSFGYSVVTPNSFSCVTHREPRTPRHHGHLENGRVRDTLNATRIRSAAACLVRHALRPSHRIQPKRHHGHHSSLQFTTTASGMDTVSP